MQAIIRYPDNRRVEVLVLSVGRYTIRAVPRESSDTLELRQSYGQWADEWGAPIEFESLVASGDEDIRGLLEMPAAGTAS
jgi:hypothetical protein